MAEVIVSLFCVRLKSRKVWVSLIGTGMQMAKRLSMYHCSIYEALLNWGRIHRFSHSPKDIVMLCKLQALPLHFLLFGASVSHQIRGYCCSWEISRLKKEDVRWNIMWVCCNPLFVCLYAFVPIYVGGYWHRICCEVFCIGGSLLCFRSDSSISEFGWYTGMKGINCLV